MFLRLALVIVLITAGTAVASSQTAPAEKKKAVPTRAVAPTQPAPEKWVEDSINHFFDLPSDILSPESKKR